MMAMKEKIVEARLARIESNTNRRYQPALPIAVYHFTKSQMWDIINLMKEAVFHPAVQKVLRSMPRELRKEVGKLILGLQLGASYTMPIARPMPSIVRGAEELRIKDASGSYRVFYLAKFMNVLIVFHAFKKKSQKTPLKEIETGRKRLKEIIDEEN
jgi:phage-related protein